MLAVNAALIFCCYCCCGWGLTTLCHWNFPNSVRNNVGEAGCCFQKKNMKAGSQETAVSVNFKGTAASRNTPQMSIDVGLKLDRAASLQLRSSGPASRHQYLGATWLQEPARISSPYSRDAKGTKAFRDLERLFGAQACLYGHLCGKIMFLTAPTS